MGKNMSNGFSTRQIYMYALYVSRDKKNPIKFNYTSHCHLLESPRGAKYLGQTIRPDLKGRARKN